MPNRRQLARHIRTGTPAAVFDRLSDPAAQALEALLDLASDRAQLTNAMPTILDIAVANGCDAVAGLIDEAAQVHPELSMGYSRTIKGRSYKTLVRTGVPSVSFRNANEGTAATKGTYENRRVETFIMDPNWACDQAVADGHEDGAEAYIAIEGSGMVEGSMQTIASQLYYGSTNDAKGFPGLAEVYDSTNMAVDAGGTTASTQTSVWAVRFGPKDCGWVWGEDGRLDLSDVTLQRLTDASSHPYWAYCQHLLAYPGFQVLSTQSVGRVHSIHPSDSNASLTDDDLADLISTFPTGRVPDAFFANRAAVAMLRKNRTATNATGTPAPFPTEAFGIPLVQTDAITSTEEPPS